MDITEYDEFYKWYKANERRFHCLQMTEVQIAYSAYLHGIEQSHKHGVMQGLLSDCCQAPVTTTEIHYCKECECSCSPTVGQRSVDTVAEGLDEDIYIKPIPTAEYKLTISKIEKIEREASGKEQP